VIDEPMLSAQSFVATNLPPGDYVWRVQTSGTVNGKSYSNWSTAQTLTVAGESKSKKRAKPPAP